MQKKEQWMFQVKWIQIQFWGFLIKMGDMQSSHVLNFMVKLRKIIMWKMITVIIMEIMDIFHLGCLCLTHHIQCWGLNFHIMKGTHHSYLRHRRHYHLCHLDLRHHDHHHQQLVKLHQQPHKRRPQPQVRSLNVVP